MKQRLHTYWKILKLIRVILNTKYTYNRCKAVLVLSDILMNMTPAPTSYICLPEVREFIWKSYGDYYNLRIEFTTHFKGMVSYALPFNETRVTNLDWQKKSTLKEL